MSISQIIFQIFCAFVASLGFGILFALRKRKLVVSGLCGAVGWGVHLLLKRFGFPPSISFMASAFAMTIYSEVFARVFKAPAITFLISGFIPIVPGSDLYYTMYYVIINEPRTALKYGLSAFVISGAIAIGVLIGTTLCKAYYMHIKPKKKGK